jgi:hypothetical protein
MTDVSPTKGRPTMAVPAQQHLPDDEVEETRVARWRFDQFRTLGFDAEDAFLLSVSGVDLQAARTLMELGCSRPLALPSCSSRSGCRCRTVSRRGAS